jgi:enoyl-CoA hydratase
MSGLTDRAPSPGGEKNRMTEENVVLVENRGPLAILTLNRPEKRNALNASLRAGLLAALESAAADRNIRAIILTGAGDKAFVAGADISEFEGRTPVDQFRVMKGASIYDALERIAKPTIAAVNGFCLGGGMELALACDIRIASASARFGQPEVNLGIIPGGGGTQRLPRIAGLGAALHLILTGEIIDAQHALRIGLVQEVVEPATLLTRAIEVAEGIASKSPVALAAAKEATRAAFNLPLTDGIKLETALFQVCFASEDKAEGVRAFLEKRAAVFPGR